MKTLKDILTRYLTTAVLLVSMAGTGCAGHKIRLRDYNIRLASVVIDREGKRDYMIGWGCAAYRGSYLQIGILNLALDNPWYRKVTPGVNWHTSEEQEKDELEKKVVTIQSGTLCYAQGRCFQLGYLTLRGNESPWYCKISPVIGWHKGKKEK